jgi:hypothetical protein
MARAGQAHASPVRSVLVAAFDRPVGVEQEPLARRPTRGERGEGILQAERQGGLAAGERLQGAAMAPTSLPIKRQYGADLSRLPGGEQLDPGGAMA